jgi:hypothetical protein
MNTTTDQSTHPKIWNERDRLYVGVLIKNLLYEGCRVTVLEGDTVKIKNSNYYSIIINALGKSTTNRIEIVSPDYYDDGRDAHAFMILKYNNNQESILSIIQDQSPLTFLDYIMPKVELELKVKLETKRLEEKLEGVDMAAALAFFDIISLPSVASLGPDSFLNDTLKNNPFMKYAFDARMLHTLRTEEIIYFRSALDDLKI